MALMAVYKCVEPS